MASVRDLDNIGNRILEEGEIQEDHIDPPESNHHGVIRSKVAENSKEDHMSGNIDQDDESYHLDRVRSQEDVSVKSVSEEEEHLITNNVSDDDETGLGGNKRSSILETEPVESSPPKRTKTSSSRTHVQVTPSYRLIPKEERSRVTHKRLNNKYCLMKFVGSWEEENVKITSYEEDQMAKCEDDMYEVDMLIGTMKSAEEKAERVIKGDMSVEDLGAMFYRCIGRLYRDQDMAELVKGDYQRVLPVILNRLKQKLLELTVAKDTWKSRWKQVFEENSAKQKDAMRNNKFE